MAERKYREIYDYLSAPDMPTSPEPVVVFGRQDERVAHAAGNLVLANLAEVIVITGGVGKDSGNLLDQGYTSEADFLEQRLLEDAMGRSYHLPELILEENASNGRENAQNSVKILGKRAFNLDSLTANTFPTSSRRLAETLKFETAKLTGKTPVVHRSPSAYEFDPLNKKDQDEAASELMRLADWPGYGELFPQTDIPENLVDFAREIHGDAPRPIKPWQTKIIRLLPRSGQHAVINFAAKHGRK